MTAAWGGVVWQDWTQAMSTHDLEVICYWTVDAQTRQEALAELDRRDEDENTSCLICGYHGGTHSHSCSQGGA